MSEQRHRPVIVLGAARSGTKFLRDLLSASGEFARVPYDVNYIWRRSQPTLEHDRLDPSRLTPRDAEMIRNALENLAGGDGNKPMIEKSVSNTLRVPFINAVYPAARFIHIIRDGRSVAESSYRMWQAPPDRAGLMQKFKGMQRADWIYAGWFAVNYIKGRLLGRGGGRYWGPRYPGIDEDLKTLPLIAVVARQWSRCVDTACEDLAQLPAQRVFQVRYEEFLREPEQLEALCDFAGVRDKRSIADTFVRKVDTGTIDKWRGKLVGEELAMVEREQAATLARFGYR